MLQHGGLPKLQSGCRVTDGANGTRVGLPGEQICGRDFVGLDGGTTGRSAADWRGHQRSWRLPKSARVSRTDRGRTGGRKVAIYRLVSARLGYAASAGPTVNRRIRRWLYPRQGTEVPWRGLVLSDRGQEEGAAKCFAYVQTYDTKPKRRLLYLAKTTEPHAPPTRNDQSL